MQNFASIRTGQSPALSEFVFDFRYITFLSKCGDSKRNWVKSLDQFSDFTLRIRIRGRMDEVYDVKFQVQPRGGPNL